MDPVWFSIGLGAVGMFGGLVVLTFRLAVVVGRLMATVDALEARVSRLEGADGY